MCSTVPLRSLDPDHYGHSISTNGHLVHILAEGQFYTRQL